jgi:hypothetical protein
MRGNESGLGVDYGNRGRKPPNPQSDGTPLRKAIRSMELQNGVAIREFRQNSAR